MIVSSATGWTVCECATETPIKLFASKFADDPNEMKTSVPGEFECRPLVYHLNEIKALNQDENHSSSHLDIDLEPRALILTMSSFTTTTPALAQSAFSQSAVEVCLQHRVSSPSRGTAEAGAPLIRFVFLC